MPVVCTGNDFSTLYAPLIRDGRMEKYYWAPTREDRVGVCFGIFQHDGVNRGDIETLVDTFPGQSIDFFGALRVRKPGLGSCAPLLPPPRCAHAIRESAPPCFPQWMSMRAALPRIAAGLSWLCCEVYYAVIHSNALV